MPEDQRHREEPYRPADGTWHQATNVLPDKWGHHIVQSLGASHAWVLTIIERLVVGYRCKARRVSISEIAGSSGLGRERVYEVLADLEETGVIAIRDRARGRKPLIAVRLDWNPTQEALAAGARLQKARSKRKHAESGDKEVPTPVDIPAEEELPTPDDNRMPTQVGNSEEQKMPTSVGNEMSTPVSNNIQSSTKEAFPGADRSSSDNGPLTGEAPGASERKERKTTPPSSSSLNPAGIRDPGENRNPVETDDERNNNLKNPDEGRDRETRMGGEGFSRAAARKSWQEVADHIREIPSERITDEARELGNVLVEKIPRLEPGLVTRLSLYCIETYSITHLGAVASAQRKKLKFEVGNPYSYLIKVLFPFSEADAGVPDAPPAELFETAYLRGETHRTLSGIGAKHQFEAVENIHPRETDGYFKEF